MTPVQAAALAGFLGWWLEAAWTGAPRYSYAMRVPWLPVYAAGGAVVAELAPRLKGRPAYERALAYAAVLTALEFGACMLDRSAGRMSWEYAGQCVDKEHAAMWGLLGLVFERMIDA